MMFSIVLHHFNNNISSLHLSHNSELNQLIVSAAIIVTLQFTVFNKRNYYIVLSYVMRKNKILIHMNTNIEFIVIMAILFVHVKCYKNTKYIKDTTLISHLNSHLNSHIKSYCR